MTTMTLNDVPDTAAVFGGVDTHKDTHTAAAVDAAGRMLGTAQFPATPAGYRQLLTWLRGQGPLAVIGVEGTGAYGAGLARHLHTEQVAVVEVDRPDRKTRRQQGKSDPVDAQAAARAALAGQRTGSPKTSDGQIEAIRNLRVARRSAIAHRAACTVQIKSLLITAPDPLREQLRHLPNAALHTTCAGLRPDLTRIADPTQAAKAALRSLARRHGALTEEINELDALLEPLVTTAAPALLELNGVGVDAAGQLLVTFGQNRERIRSEGAFAMLCAAAPLPASSGRTNRHRLNRGGDRQANATLYRIVLSRMRWDPRTRDYVTRRTTEGLSKKEIIRCLKRYIAREIYYTLTQPDASTPPTNTA